MSERGTREAPSIWWWAFGYFAAYAPYAALTKAITSGMLDHPKVGGTVILPATVIATVVTAIAFLIATGWWRHANKPVGRRQIPLPTTLTTVSGLCASGIIATTTLAYTFEGISIVFVMLLMRGGLLVLAPAIDLLTGRRIRWYSMAALVLSIASLVISTMLEGGAARITLICAIDVALYLTFYFVRLQIMSRKAKSKDADANLRYFVEEQLVSSPALLLFLGVAAIFGMGEFGMTLRAGFTDFWSEPVWPYAILIGILSQGTGIFGGLILLDKSENTFSIPVNRASSVVAGVVGSAALWLWLDAKAPKDGDLVGAAVMVAAILVLSFGAIADKRRTQDRIAKATAVSAR
jgi:hypothetical protein